MNHFIYCVVYPKWFLLIRYSTLLKQPPGICQKIISFYEYLLHSGKLLHQVQTLNTWITVPNVLDVHLQVCEQLSWVSYSEFFFPSIQPIQWFFYFYISIPVFRFPGPDTIVSRNGKNIHKVSELFLIYSWQIMSAHICHCPTVCINISGIRAPRIRLIGYSLINNTYFPQYRAYLHQNPSNWTGR